jgi:hypothetical protein
MENPHWGIDILDAIMAVDNPDVVDIMSIDPCGSVVLTVSDHLDWINSASHQSILQAKINRYLAFVESGEILDRYPDARGRNVVIQVITQHGPDAEALSFLERARHAVGQAGIEFVWRRYQPARPK